MQQPGPEGRPGRGDWVRDVDEATRYTLASARWLLGVLGAGGVGLAAGAQLSGVGRLNLDDARLWVAVAAAMVAAGGAVLAVRATLGVHCRRTGRRAPLRSGLSVCPGLGLHARVFDQRSLLRAPGLLSCHLGPQLRPGGSSALAKAAAHRRYPPPDAAGRLDREQLDSPRSSVAHQKPAYALKLRPRRTGNMDRRGAGVDRVGCTRLGWQPARAPA